MARGIPVRALLSWALRRSPLLVPLAAAVIILQTLVIIRMASDQAIRMRITDETSETTTLGSNINESSSLLPLTLAADNPFDLKTCGCGLHFKVDYQKAMLVSAPQQTEKRFLAIGIPTIRRRNDSYISKTVTSLLSNLNNDDRTDVIIVVMIADLDPKDRQVNLRDLQAKFKDEIAAGSLHVIAPPHELYSNFKVTKRTYGQAQDYVEWRSKQNFDYAFLMRYSAPLARYYMQLEDDVITARNYITNLRAFIDDQTDSWICLEFSELGFIGKLYRSRDLDRLSSLLLMFFQEQPVDYTYLYFNMLMTQMSKRLRTPTLFQHQGTHSSFPGKIQPLKDRFFDNMVKQYKGDNPPAELVTTLRTYLNFLPRMPYEVTEGYFWSHGAPAVGDSFTIVFHEPQRLDRVVIETGSESHPNDIIEGATLKASLTLVKTPSSTTCVNDIELGRFVGGRVEVKGLGDVIKFKAVCLQIDVTAGHTNWAIVREVAVFLLKDKGG